MIPVILTDDEITHAVVDLDLRSATQTTACGAHHPYALVAFRPEESVDCPECLDGIDEIYAAAGVGEAEDVAGEDQVEDDGDDDGGDDDDDEGGDIGGPPIGSEMPRPGG